MRPFSLTRIKALTPEEMDILRNRSPFVCSYDELITKHYEDNENNEDEYKPPVLLDVFFDDCDDLRKSLNILRRRKIQEMKEARKNPTPGENVPTLQDIKDARRNYTMSEEEVNFLRDREPGLCDYDEIADELDIIYPDWTVWDLVVDYFKLNKNLRFIKRRRLQKKKKKRLASVAGTAPKPAHLDESQN